MLTLFAAAFVLGLIFNATPGAVFAETARQAVAGGYRPALAVQFGSLLGDAVWAVLGLVGVGLLLQLEALRIPIGLAGAVYLIWLSVDSWRAARNEFSVSGAAPPCAESARQRERRALRSGAVLSLTNPQNMAYWAALGSAMGAVGVVAPRAQDYAVFFGGFMASSLLWCFVCAWGLARLLARAGQTWVRLTYRLCALAFAALALASLRDLWQRLPESGGFWGRGPVPMAAIAVPWAGGTDRAGPSVGAASAAKPLA